MAVTQKDIADRLNLSQAHVARALSGSHKVSAATRERIEMVAREMGYELEANREARALVARRYGRQLKTGVIAAVFHVDGIPLPSQLPFFRPLLEGVEAEAAALGVDVCVCLMRPAELPRMIRDKNVDGVMLVGFAHPEDYARHAVDLPVVLFHATSDWSHNVTSDDRQGMYLATKHLLELGHRDIAFLGMNGGGLSLLRHEGFRAAMADYDAPVREEWFFTDWDIPQTTPVRYCVGCNKCAACIGWERIKQQLKLEPGQLPSFTAVVCHNDAIAMGLVEHAKADGIQVPEELSVTGVDDVTPEYHFSPAITSVSSENFEIGRRALRLLHEDIERGVADYSYHVQPVALQVRESTSVPRKARALSM